MRQEKQNRNTLMSGCQNVGMVFRVAFYVFAVFAALNLILGLWSAFQPADSFSVFMENGRTVSAELPGSLLGTQMLSSDYLLPSAAEHPKGVYQIAFWTSWLSGLLATAILWRVRAVFRNIDLYETPFLPENVHALRDIGILAILLPLLPKALRIILFALTGLLRDWSYNGSDFLVSLFVGAVILCLSRIFAYGCTLQRESDETI